MWQLTVGNPTVVATAGEVDTALEWFTAVTTLVGFMAWPLVVAFGLWAFRLPIAELINRTEKFGVGPASAAFRAALEEVAKDVEMAPAAASSEAVAEVDIQEEDDAMVGAGTVSQPTEGHTESTSTPEVVRFRTAYGEDRRLGSWEFFPRVSSGNRIQDAVDSVAYANGGLIRLAEKNPAASVMYSYKKIAELIPSHDLPDVLDLNEWFSSPFALANVPKALRSAYQSLRAVALAGQKGGLSPSDALEFDANVDAFVFKVRPYLQANVEEVARALTTEDKSH